MGQDPAVGVWLLHQRDAVRHSLHHHHHLLRKNYHKEYNRPTDNTIFTLVLTSSSKLEITIQFTLVVVTKLTL